MASTRQQPESPLHNASRVVCGGRPPFLGISTERKRISLDPETLLLSIAPLAVIVRLAKSRPWALLRVRSLVVTLFHILYNADQKATWRDTCWLGLELQKCPLDLWIYQEIIYQTKPDVILETGTLKGGSAYFFASIFDLMKHGRVITIDVKDHPEKPQHERITYLLGSSTSENTIRTVRSLIGKGEKVMVSLDSNHTKTHVLDELRLYSELVTVGNYLVLEDTCLNGHPVMPKWGPGPMEALKEFLEQNRNFVPDASREKFGLTFSPRGYVKKVG